MNADQTRFALTEMIDALVAAHTTNAHLRHSLLALRAELACDEELLSRLSHRANRLASLLRGDISCTE